MNFLSKFLKGARHIKVRTMDAMLNAERATFTGTELGLRWVGDLKPVGEGLAAIGRITDKALRNKIIAAAISDMTGLLSSSSNARPEQEFTLKPQLDDEPNIGAGASPDDINTANSDYWGGRKTNDSVPRIRPTVGSCSTAEKMADQIGKFWADRNGAPRPMTTRDAAGYARALNAPSMATRVEAINEMNRQYYGVK